ncbi:MAG: replicative DNA helicase [Lachnospiraceae bacterium]|nr:replicative DNA helicase [Lachnospiraceae bacterium]
MDEERVVRTKPQSLLAEQSVVGAMIGDVDAIITAMETLKPEDFYYKQYRLVFETIVELYNSGSPIDPVTLLNALKNKKDSAEVANIGTIADLVAAVPVTVNVGSYAQIVKEKSLLRQIIEMNQEIEEACYLQEESVDDILDRTEAAFLSLLQSRGVSEFVPIDEIVMNALNRIEAASKMSGNVTGIATGFTELDFKTAGLQNSDLVLIAARPSMGKTAFALNIAEYVAFRKDMCVAFFSLEMSKEQLVNRLLSMESYLDAQKLRTGDLKDSDWVKLIEGSGIVGQSKLIIDDTPGISVSQMRSKCRKYKQEHDLKLVMVDYLGLMSSGKKADSRQQEVSDISRGLKALARELNVPVVALSQLNRGVEQREDKRPMLSDLRDSGAIEQDADVVMFLYRDDYYHKDKEPKNISEVIIAKQRNGPVGKINLVWLPEFTKFANFERSG